MTSLLCSRCTKSLGKFTCTPCHRKAHKSLHTIIIITIIIIFIIIIVSPILWGFICIIYSYSSGLLHWHWGNLTFAPVPAKQSGKIWVRSSDTKSQKTLRWLHNGRDSVLNHSFRRRSKKTSKLRVTGLCAGIQRGPVNSPHKWPVTRKMFPFDDVIMVHNKARAVSVFLEMCCAFCAWGGEPRSDMALRINIVFVLRYEHHWV